MRPFEGEPLVMADASEVARYLFLMGLEPRLAQTEEHEDGTQTWHVPRFDGPPYALRVRLSGGDGPSQVLDPADLHNFSVRMVQAIPTSPNLLGPGYLDVVLGHLTEAVAARRQLRLFLPDGADAIPVSAFHSTEVPLQVFTRAAIEGVDEMLAVLVSDMVAARRGAAPYPPEQMMFPQESFRLPDEARAQIPEVPCPVDALAALLRAGWGLVDDNLPGHAGLGLLRHQDGAMLEVRVEDDTTLVDTRLVEGVDALWSWVNNGFELTPEASSQLRMHLVPGRPFLEAMHAALDGIAVNVSGIARFDAGNDRTQRILLADQLAPRRRGSVVAVLSDSGDVITGAHILGGATGYDQLSRVLRRASLENATDPRLQALARLEAAADDVRVLLGRFLDPDADLDALNALIRPRAGDAARAFRADTAPSIERAMAEQSFSVRPESHHTELTVQVASVADLAAGAIHTRPFPKAYAQVAPFLMPDTLWVTWTFHAAGEKGTRYDGLVLVDDHWAWFPKPWRMIEHA